MKKPILTESLPNGPAFEMIFVEGGSFLIGSEEEEAYFWEKPVHKVQLDGFYIGKFPVTQALWKAVMNENPSFFTGDSRPVESVSWEDAQQFLEKLNELTGKAYRLPTEAEWEYAARGGQQSKGYKYAGSNKLKEVGWYAENSHVETKAVGLKYPNELGLYDMSGNVWEWVEDHWHDNYNGALADGSAWVDSEKGPFRVLRGGAWFYYPGYCRCTNRIRSTPLYRGDCIGFRLVLPLQF